MNDFGLGRLGNSGGISPLADSPLLGGLLNGEGSLDMSDLFRGWSAGEPVGDNVLCGGSEGLGGRFAEGISTAFTSVGRRISPERRGGGGDGG